MLMFKYYNENHLRLDEILSPLSCLVQKAVYRCHKLNKPFIP